MSNLFGQQDEQMSTYMFNPLKFNPAYAGSRNSVNISAIGRFQWVDFKGAPYTQWASFHMPLMRQTLGIGLNMVHDKIGSRERTSVFANFAVSLRLNKKGHRLNIGANAGLDINSYNFLGLNVVDPTDPLYQNGLTEYTPNFGAGLYYFSEKHYVGVSVPRLLENTFNVNNVTNTISNRHFFISGGYVFNLSPVVKFKPSTLVKFTLNAPLAFDINASFFFYDKFWIGGMYRFHESVGVNCAFTIAKVLQVGYAFDYPINGLRAFQYGSHEIMLMIDLKSKKTSGYSPRYF